MQLRHRIKKIENRIIIDKPKYCMCYEKHWRSAIESAYNDDPNAAIKMYPMPDIEKEFCDKCQKSFSSLDIQMHKNIQEIYGDKE